MRVSAQVLAAWAGDESKRDLVPLSHARLPFALDRLRELDREHLIYDPPKPGPGGSGPQLLTPLELLDRLAALVPESVARNASAACACAEAALTPPRCSPENALPVPGSGPRRLRESPGAA